MEAPVAVPRIAVQTQGLSRAFGPKVIVNKVTLAVAEGQVYGYLGLNGAGKSTTIKMLATLLMPTAGHAWIEGHHVVAEPLAVRRAIGLVGDEGGPDARPYWTAREYLRHFARIQRVHNVRADVEAVMDLMGLDAALRNRRILSYSTGEKRRVEVARAFLGRPRVLFLDEPTRGLDLPAKREMWDFFRHLAKKENVTMFLSSHDSHEIQTLCERLSVIKDGRIAFSGHASQLGGDLDAFEKGLVRLLRGPQLAGARNAGGFVWARA